VTVEISQYQIRELVSLNDPYGVWLMISREQRWETGTLIETLEAYTNIVDQQFSAVFRLVHWLTNYFQFSLETNTLQFSKVFPWHKNVRRNWEKNNKF
jgi:hypothetical protein